MLAHEAISQILLLGLGMRVNSWTGSVQLFTRIPSPVA